MLFSIRTVSGSAASLSVVVAVTCKKRLASASGQGLAQIQLCPSSAKCGLRWRCFPAGDMFSQLVQQICSSCRFSKSCSPVFVFFKICRRMRTCVALLMSLLAWLCHSYKQHWSLDKLRGEACPCSCSRFNGIPGACKAPPLSLASRLRHDNQPEAYCDQCQEDDKQCKGPAVPRKMLWNKPLLWSSCVAQLRLLAFALNGFFT